MLQNVPTWISIFLVYIEVLLRHICDMLDIIFSSSEKCSNFAKQIQSNIWNKIIKERTKNIYNNV